MRIPALACCLVLLACGSASTAKADDAAAIAAINASSNALDEAFTNKDTETIKALMTPDHLTVTPYYDGPQTVQDQLATLGEYDWSQTIVGEPEVSLVSSGVALRTFTAKLEGTYKGKTLPAKVFVTELLVERDGKWIERLYQVTAQE